MLWTPWQLAQLATVCEPAFAARPWNEASKLTSAVRGKPELARQPHVAVAAPACGANVAAAHRRRRIAGRQDGVLAVAVGANRRLRHARPPPFRVRSPDIRGPCRCGTCRRSRPLRHERRQTSCSGFHAPRRGRCRSQARRRCLCGSPGRECRGRARRQLAGGTRANRFWDAFRMGYSSCFTWQVVQGTAA